MKTIVLAAFAALPLSSIAQQTNSFIPFPDNGVYLSASDFSRHKLTDSFDNGQSGYRIRQEAFKRTLKIDQPNAPEEKIPLADMWGERKDGVDYRSFDGELYRVEHTDRLYIYSKPTNPGALSGGPTYHLTNYYFSRKANSPIHLITSANLEDIYYDMPDKQDAFEQLSDLSDHPSNQARQLIQLFYKNDQQTSRAAD
ncbi:hypothetical protein [Spirosoma koreense]